MTLQHRNVWLILALTGIMIFAAAFWLRPVSPSVPEYGVRVIDVAALSKPQKSLPLPVQAFPSVPRFDDLTDYERVALTMSRIPDLEWTPAAEKRLVSSIESTMMNLKLEKVHCAQGACQIVGILGLAGRSQDEALRQLLDGGVQRGLRVAGFIENGDMVIDADGPERLRFYQYVALPNVMNSKRVGL